MVIQSAIEFEKESGSEHEARQIVRTNMTEFARTAQF
jgi:hypothetical protein